MCCPRIFVIYKSYFHCMITDLKINEYAIEEMIKL